MADHDSIVRVEKEGDDAWRVHVREWGSVPTKDRALADNVFNMVLRAYNVGRREAFQDLRELIGAE